MIGEIALRVGAEAVVAPVLTSVVSATLQKSRQRKRCSFLHTMLLRAPPSFVDDIAKVGIEEGCWTESFVKGFLEARGVKKIAKREDRTKAVKQAASEVIKHQEKILRNMR